MRGLLLVTALVALAAPALAQTAEFYIVQDTKTKKCTIVDKKVVQSKDTIVTASYKTRAEAEAAVRAVKVCTSN
jgi:hypothetical protein